MEDDISLEASASGEGREALQDNHLEGNLLTLQTLPQLCPPVSVAGVDVFPVHHVIPQFSVLNVISRYGSMEQNY